MMKPFSRALALIALLSAPAFAQTHEPMLSEATTQVSDHVWAIMGFPNIGIVVGNRATLIVDTGLGPKNGATVARVAAKLAPHNQKLFLTTTHFHPEHAGGEPGFPAGTILIRDAVQQQEMEKHGQEMMDMFSQRSPQNKELLAGACARRTSLSITKSPSISEASPRACSGLAARIPRATSSHLSNPIAP